MGLLGAAPPSSASQTRNLLRTLADQQQRVRQACDGLKGARHASGGCFVGCNPGKENPDVLVYPFIRSASRHPLRPGVRGYAILGFRVVLAPQVGAKKDERNLP